MTPAQPTTETQQAIDELCEALRLTVEYAGPLPALPGWSWYDALSKYAPGSAESLRQDWLRAEAAQR